MKFWKRFGREYRLLVLAIVFFMVGGILFWRDASLPPSSALQPAVAVQSTAPAERGGTALDPDFGNFPPPSDFATFTYKKNGINGSSTLSVSTKCNAAYVTILAYPSAIDYRGDINAAVYNQAFVCSAGKPFMTSIATSDIANAPFGEYYMIVADEGTTGTWYNPR